ncbi:NUMOD4 motif-containing HNH endonuclease [Gordonia alkanivorans]|uniref:HNH endonuclease n=2 Tax=root TaxID=1 RepID=A0A159B6C5_9CAUD|nr:HNH endonuclease [Gordonia phage GAL1]AKJ72042.1 hypothetical protein GAL1_27 [Gordonia phage GAL1]GAA13816.1 hypothetical protein GOALK_093_00040 [Gordonia alkanivorans NBRC 16433]
MNATPVEEWRAIPGWEGLYEVSDQGRVKSLERFVQGRYPGILRRVPGRVLKGSLHKSTGYLRVTMSRDNQMSVMLIHRLVMLAFVGPLPAGFHTCHNNGDATDNRLTNLRYDTASENRLDSVRHGTNHETSKTRCPKGHPYDETNTLYTVRPDRPGRRSRYCRQCNKDNCRERYAAGLK